MPTATPISRVNDFVIRFANVNGSGSASANEMFARAVMRMGVPVAPRNIFPSNIQGLPTWYEVRVTEAGHLGARGGVDMMVAMNPQTWDKDVASIEPGGYLFYDSSRPIPPAKLREDLTVIGVPLNHLVGRRFRVGDVILRGGRLNFPCKYLEELLGLPVFLPLYNRYGLNCGIERSGIIRPGDSIELLDR
jgi:MOSC domain-containing protein YiiM